MRRPAPRVKPRLARPKSFPAPVHGWIANTNLATPNARWRDGSPLAGATLLENWLPTATGIRMRGGSQKYATVGDQSSQVSSIFSYVAGSTEKLFCSDDAGIYDISSPADPDTPAVAEVGSLTGGQWSFVQFATSGGIFLRGVNGADTPLVYDGSAWATTPAITGVTPENLSFLWSFKNRLFFIQKNTLDAWYLPVDSIGGAAVKFPLGGVFTRGGSLLFGASWSLDENAGLSASCVFVTSEGEVAVYKGSDPGDATDWSLVGVYRIGKPRGPKAFIRAGGDLVIATDIGFVPLSQAIQKDLAALSPNAVSYPIEVAWNEAVADRSAGDWHCEVWPAKQMVLVALHNGAGDQPQMFSANARTGAWGLITGWNGKCLHVLGERCFFGSTAGTVIEAEVTGGDQEVSYTAVCVPLFDPLKTPASIKTGLQARAVLRAPAVLEAKLSLQKDYVINLPNSPDEAPIINDSVWGGATWGQSQWSAPAQKSTFLPWRSVPGSGYALSVAVQISSGSVPPPDVDLVQIDLLYDLGDVVT